MSDRMHQIVKLLRAVDLVARAQGATIKDLEEGLGVKRSSVYREIRILEQLGFPLYTDRPQGSRQQRWLLEPGYVQRLPNISLPDVRMTVSEMLALYMALSESSITRSAGFGERLDGLMVKLRHCFPEEMTEKLGRIQTLFVFTSKFSKDYSTKEDIIGDLSEAMLHQNICLVRYHAFSEDRVNHFKIEPLHFFEHAGGLYAYVRTPKHGDVITLAVERIMDLKVTDQEFEYPKDFDPQMRLAQAFGVTSDNAVFVRIRFSKDQARYVKERRWAAKQRIVENEDGSLVLEMTTAGLWEIARWVLTWGGDAEVLEPDELRVMVANEVGELAGIYL
ncbi:Predicted DNA-binding transcriptional regulator YafY, contains an HTH and WYL domains [Desulfonatronum thiosulfatophilum]|uniref:Predicted DNA-binding transcriptional regulator YafY, contains an HTH and WYL domains n=1 Tax=Desulfonatronum thiosulfatophilum TaxID=617002 RepID=A0A1G6DDV7_9BACT|nr:WYL domain-containing transcriptional regulator [Desulfonatronum thiosulfatophilum]SDB43312.1 Predicted DNA-binding transcriptional regulator YafY, contains an HTH and WYL domains [Desulfonatronum thiosulfatophilum]